MTQAAEGPTEVCPAARGVVLEAGCYRLLDNKETCRGPWRSLTLAGLTVAELRACHPPPTAPPAGVQGSLWPIAAAWLCLLAWHLDGSQHLALNEQHLSNQGTLRTQSGDEASDDQGGKEGLFNKNGFILFFKIY